MATNEEMNERLERVERKVDDLGNRLVRLDERLQGVEVRMERVEERMYGLEDRFDAMNTRIDVTRDELRGDIKLALERIDGLQEFLERSRTEEPKSRAADQGLLYALVKDHNRRLRALERLERRQQMRT